MGYLIPYYERVRIILERIEKERCKFYDDKGYDKYHDSTHVDTCDVCDKYFGKSK